MGKLSLDKFLLLLERSKLVDSAKLHDVVNAWKSRASLWQLDDSRPCADYLVESGLVTDWQCKKLEEGRYRGFFLGKYKLLDHLGSGGMSSVYLAEHVLMQRRVAVKVLPQNRVSDSSYLARFHFEAQAAAALDHRNIVRAYDLDSDGKIHYLVMEYVEGRDLHAMVCHDGPLDFHLAANYIAQAALGLDHAHHAAMVHRDIKPANLLVDLKGTLKILDMGLAKFTAGKSSSPGFAQDEQVLGTADYLAPEQALNSQTVDHRADIYSLGCTLYYLLTGHPPFASGTPLERMTAHQQQLPPSIALARPDVPLELVTICRKMMEKSADNRYQSASEVHHALQEWLAAESALGRVAIEAAVGAKHPSSRPMSPAEQSGSRINLVSGSGSDLRILHSEPLVSSSLQDTDPNLHRATVRIPSRASEQKSERNDVSPSKSHVLHASPNVPDAIGARDAAHLTPPPLVAPPLALAEPPWPRDPRLPTPDLVNEIASTPQLAEFAFSHESLHRAKQGRRISNSSWLWAIVVSGAVFIAVLFALLAMQS